MVRFGTYLAVTIFATVMLCALCGCSVLTDDTSKRYAAYYEQYQEYVSLYGSPSAELASLGATVDVSGLNDAAVGDAVVGVAAEGDAIASGVSFVRLVDMNNDKAEELVIGYIATGLTSDAQASGPRVAVFSFAKGKISCDYEGDMSLYGTNGFFPYIAIAKLKAGGWALLTESCFGSSPARFTYNLLGYSKDQFGALAGKAFQYGVDCTYYSCPSGSGDVWQPSNWKPISEPEYEVLFDSLVGEVDYFYLYRSDVDSAYPDSSFTHGSSSISSTSTQLCDVIMQSEETVALLAEKANASR